MHTELTLSLTAIAAYGIVVLINDKIMSMLDSNFLLFMLEIRPQSKKERSNFHLTLGILIILISISLLGIVVLAGICINAIIILDVFKQQGEIFRVGVLCALSIIVGANHIKLLNQLSTKRKIEIKDIISWQLLYIITLILYISNMNSYSILLIVVTFTTSLIHFVKLKPAIHFLLIIIYFCTVIFIFRS